MANLRSAHLTAALILLAALMGCEGVFNELVAIPEVNVECTTPKCQQGSGARNFYVYISKSPCQNPFFGDYITGTGVVGCGSGACVGQVSVWTQQDSAVITTMNSGIYSVCAVIALQDPDVPGLPNFNTSGNARAAQDVTINAETKTIEFTNWQDIL